MTELWTVFVNRPFDEFEGTVKGADQAGYDGLYIADSQNIMPEAWVLLGVGSALSDRLKLGTFVTNPLTRHPATTAAAAATLQQATRGRVVLTVGRGDSAHAHLGYGPMKLKPFEEYLARLQGFLRGEDVPFVDDGDWRGTTSLASLEYGNTPKASHLRWLPRDLPKVTVEVAASGPKVIAAAARQADGVALGLGVEPERIAWGVGEARNAALAAGRDPASLTMTALVSVTVHPDRDTALSLSRGAASSIGRWQMMQNAAKANLDQRSSSSLDHIRHNYDMTKHGESDSSHGDAIAPDMIDRFAIAGPPEHCIPKLRELMDLGLTRLVIPPLNTKDRALRDLTQRLLNEEVLPALR